MKNISYEDDPIIPMGTPIYAGPMGGGVVRIPISKQERLDWKNKVASLKGEISSLREELKIYKKYLSWKAKRKLKKRGYI